MRPLKVTMEGFSTFLATTEVDFAGVDLVALVGPTGSGKSSIIDAITFALYGSVARYDDTRLVAPVIHQRANEARVRLDFEVGGRDYTAVRVVRRSKGDRATTREARLEQLTELDEEASPVLASGAKELTDAVERLLGLDFAQFTRTVVLPQGDFAEFLTDDPASRQRLLRRLLDLEVYARMGVQARELAKAASQKAEVLEGQLARHDELTPELLTSQRHRLERLIAFDRFSTGLLAQMDEIEARLVGLRGTVNELDRDLECLGRVVLPAAVSDGGEVLVRGRALLDQARAALDVARVRRDQAQQAMAASGEPAAIEAGLISLRRALELSTEIADLNVAREAAGLALERVASKVTAAESTAAVAEATLRSARLGADAAAWTSSLRPGEPCPVCHQEVRTLPDHDPSAELETAERSVAETLETLAGLRAESNALQSSAHTLGARLEDRRREQEAVPAVVTADEIAQLAQRLDESRLLVAQLKADEAAVTQAERMLVEAEREVERAESQERELRQAFSAQRDGVASMSPPPAGGRSLVDDWRLLVDWAIEGMSRRQLERKAIADEGRSLAERKAELLGQLAERAVPLGLDADPVQLPQSLARAQAATEAEMARIEERLAELEEWRVEIGRLRADQRVNESLGRQLSAGGFEGWLLTEALEDLVDRASIRLQELSNGQYTLAVHDRSFRIVDHNNAGEQRDVRTLSGGETFLASLSLALALADSIRELAPVDSPRLGSMFLDEGFGTLDADTLDLVASTIEELSSTGRLVGIVTHIEPLAERMPVRYQVTKGSYSSSVERVMA